MGTNLADPITIDGTTLKLRIMETTDVHTNFMTYDYFKDAPADTVGLVKTADLGETSTRGATELAARR